MTKYDEDRMKKILKDRCRANGCQKIGPQACQYCGFNLAEEEKRLNRGLVLDPNSGLLHYVPTKKPGPPSIIGVNAED